jgi:AmmeMemoRadiSam system protein B
MVRSPAVAGKFYPANPRELSALIQRYTHHDPAQKPKHVRACMVPHAGYVYSGAVAGAVFSQIALPKKIILLGVRHFPRGEALAILSEGTWRTPLGEAPVDGTLAKRLREVCPALREDSVAHSQEHSLEVELPFLQELDPGFSFVPVALGTVQFERLTEVGEAVAKVVAETKDDVLVVTSSDMNHYENDETTRRKDHLAIEKLLQLDAYGLYQICLEREISMCGLGPAVAMLTAMGRLGARNADLVRYATSGDISGERDAVVGYAGMTFA